MTRQAYQKNYQKGYKEKNKENLDEYQKQYKEKNKDYQKNYYQNTTKAKRKVLSLNESLKIFKREILWGPIYPCICCHRTLFRKGVSATKIPELEKHSIFSKAIDESLLENGSAFLVKEKFWICHTCLSSIKKNSLPKMSSMNSLQIPFLPACLNLTEVELSLIHI